MEWLVLLLHATFSWISLNSLQASFLVLVILLFKLILGGYLPARFHYGVWFLLIIKLAVPLSLASPLSLFNWLPAAFSTPVPYPSSRAGTAALQVDVPLQPPHFVAHPDTYTYMPEEARFFWFGPLSFLWLLGVIVFAVATAWSARSFSARKLDMQPVHDIAILQLYASCKKQLDIAASIPLSISSAVTSPALLGIWRPRILLPALFLEKLDADELRHIFLHELCHYKRHDIAVNGLAHALLILNWFNPLMWYAVFRMRQDQEVACDAMTLACLRESEVTAYGYTMVKALELYANPQQSALTAGFASSKKYIKRRIHMIRRFQRTTYAWATFSISAIIALGAFTLTGAQETWGKEPLFHLPVAGEVVSGGEQYAISIMNKEGTPVKASAAGTVIKAAYDAKSGNHVVVAHEDGYQTVYAHLEKLEVEQGALVAQDQLIGLLGSTGRSTGPHLLFQMTKDGAPVDPLKYLPQQAAN